MAATSNGSRLLRGIGALLLLLGVIIGVPVALVILGGNPLPTAITWADLRDALFTPDDGTILLGLVTIIGWLAWAVFALSVVLELITVALAAPDPDPAAGAGRPRNGWPPACWLPVVSHDHRPDRSSRRRRRAPAPPALILPASTPPAEPPPAAEPDAVPAGQTGIERGRVHVVRARGRPVDPGRALLRAGNRTGAGSPRPTPTC